MQGTQSSTALKPQHIIVPINSAVLAKLSPQPQSNTWQGREVTHPPASHLGNQECVLATMAIIGVVSFLALLGGAVTLGVCNNYPDKCAPGGLQAGQAFTAIGAIVFGIDAIAACAMCIFKKCQS